MLQFIDSFQMGLPGLSGSVSGAALAVTGATIDLDFTKDRLNYPMGPELLVNPEFATDISSWTPFAANGGNVAGVVWATGALSVTGTGSGITGAYQPLTTVPGRTYEVYVVPRAGSQALNIVVNDGTIPSGPNLAGSIQVFAVPTSVRFTALSAASVLSFNRGGATTALLESVSVREVDPQNLGNELVVNGAFTTDVSSWALAFSGTVTWSAGKLRVTSSGGLAARAMQTLTGLVPGAVYTVTAQVTGNSAAFVPAQIFLTTASNGSTAGLFAGNPNSASTPRTETFTFVAPQSTVYLCLLNVSTTATDWVEFDNVSVKEINPSAGRVLTVVRASAGVAERRDGTYREFAAHEPRITDRGLLVEENRTNRIPWSQDYMQGAWVKSEVTIALDPAVMTPFGTPAAAITENMTNGAKGFTPAAAFQFTAGTTETVSTIVKAAGRGWTRIFVDGNGGTNPFVSGLVQAYVNLTTGEVASATVGAVKTRRLADGWWFIEWTFTPDTTTSTGRVGVRATTDAGIPTYQGDGRLAMYAAHTQCEVGPYATSPIKTGASGVARNADSIQVGIGSWYNPAAGTLHAETSTARQHLTSRYPGLASLSDGTGTNRIGINSNGASTWDWAVTAGGTTTALQFKSGALDGSKVKTALAYTTNDARAAWNGALLGGADDTTVTVPTAITKLDLGVIFSGTNWLNDYVERVAYFPRRITNNELLALTT